MTAIRSQKYLRGSRRATCKLRIAGTCTGDVETVVPAHIRDRHTGGAIKASDLSVVDACAACHARFDGQAGHILSRAEWLFYALRGLQETLEARHELGLLFVPLDEPKPFADRPTKRRKPKADRKAIPQRVKVPAKPQHTATRPVSRREGTET